MTFGAIDKFKDFWVNHYIDWIPDHLLKDIGDLFNSQIISDTSEDVLKVFAFYLKSLGEARQVYIISSMTSIGLIDAVIDRLKNGIQVEVIITKDLFEKLDKEPYFERVTKYQKPKWARCDLNARPLGYQPSAPPA